ncbi:MAG: hypothetical protein EPO52_13670 [Herbiconiux sp.]|uniref:hypothetical protein n=1 Tax=Herbiconiux sp. TaxID=1871186 RepID=UPI001204F7D0|nr:hypothetical protein [Herbiconiux sp.]TAJ46608.1 MAG: hypothetical protein EPO52_13670 [Herbiconiux sp.]
MIGRRGSARAWLVGSGVLALGGLAGCVGQPLAACPAVGYVSTLSVQLQGDASAIEEVRVCDLQGLCSVPEASLVPAATSPSTAVSQPQPLEYASPEFDDPVEVQPMLATGRFDGRMWVFVMYVGASDVVTATAYRGDGTVAGEVSSPLTWQRVGGTAECGGPMEAGPVILPVS